MKNITIKIALLTFCISVLLSLQASAQLPVKLPIKLPKLDTVVKDTIPKIPKTSIKPYATIIKKGTITKKGLFTVHQVNDQYFFEIPDSIIGRDIMIINRLTQGPAGYGVYAGEQLDNNARTIQFTVGKDTTIRIRDILVIAEADKDDQINKAVMRSSLAPTLLSFPIKAFGDAKHSYVIDVTKFLKERGLLNFVDPASKFGKNVLGPTVKDIIVEAFDAFPMNVELTISKTMDSRLPGMPAGTLATIEVRSSFIALPKSPMQRRYKDQRVGYFADISNVFGDRQQKAENREFILRWRMEPKLNDIERYKKGQLVEPATPIVIYIDPATPKVWRPYLIQGINDWQKAFEQAGFKNAIIGKEWPENDPTMNIDDARYSFVRYLPSETANAYGPNIHDPRSGEIIQTNIGWYHNVMSLLHDWYQVQAGAVDPEARKAKFSDELMGKLIRFVSSHEVGHTLGLRHNFLASSQTPVDSLRSRSYLKKYGHTSSIMDYARFNYVAQPEDRIAQAELFPRIGAYDEWAIEWGYKILYAGNADEERKVLSKMIADKVKPGSRLFWTEDEMKKKGDPRSQTEDLGDNAAKAGVYGIKNLKRIMPQLAQWSVEEGDLRDNLSNSNTAVLQQYTRYVNHVLNLMGSKYFNTQTSASKEDTYSLVPKSKQREALSFFESQVFNTPLWLLENAKKVDQFDPATIEDLQVRVLNSLLDPALLEKMRTNQNTVSSEPYPINEYVDDVHQLVWKELSVSDKVEIDSYHRNLQKAYLGNVIDIFLVNDPVYAETDIHSIIVAELLKLNEEIEAALKKPMNSLEKYHLTDMKAKIKKAIDAKS
jgi:hypothetical protein